MSYFKNVVYQADKSFKTEDEAFSYINKHKEELKKSYLLYRKEGESFRDFEIFNDENIAYEVYADDVSKKINEIINEKDLKELKQAYKQSVEDDDFHYFSFFDGEKINVNPYIVAMSSNLIGLINKNIDMEEFSYSLTLNIEKVQEMTELIFHTRNDFIKRNVEDCLRFLTNTWDDEVSPNMNKISDIKLISLCNYFHYKDDFKNTKFSEEEIRKQSNIF